MKKTFKLDHPKIKKPRMVDSVKHEIKKYLKRERNKTLPEGAKYWGFNCKVGQTETTAITVTQASLNKSIDALVESDTNILYVEILAEAKEFVEAVYPDEEDSEDELDEQTVEAKQEQA